MKMTTKLISLLVSLVLVLTVFTPVTALAFTDENSWQDYLKDSKGLYIAPGADDTEMYFAWFGGKDGVAPTVKISEKSDMSNPVVFTGTVSSNEKIERSNHVTATGLEKGKTYYYVCSDGTTDSAVYSFKTLAPGADFSAMYVSDIHVTGESYDDPELYASAKRFDAALEDAKSKRDISLVLSGGDQATTANPWEYDAALSNLTVKSIPLSMAIGNHDVKRFTYDAVANFPNTKTKSLSKSLISGDYYFTKGNALFLVLDSTNSSAADHYSFVKNAVKENPDAQWRIVILHHDLYGGHIQSRESENKLLRLLFTPIIDKFQIDLVLAGHSHCYSQSHVIYKSEITQNTSAVDSVTDPKGTIYVTNGTLRVSENVENPETVFNSDRKSEYVDTDCITNVHGIYNILDFTDNSLTINSYFVGEDEPFNKFTINKTSRQGGHPDEATPLWFTFGKYIGTIYNIINNISRKIEINERG